MRSAASIRSASLRPPAIRPASRDRASGTSLSRSSVLSVASRMRCASRRTSGQRLGSSPTNVVMESSLSGGSVTAFRSSAVRDATGMFATNVESTTWTRGWNAATWSAAVAIALSLVKSYWNGTALRAAWRAAVGADLAVVGDRLGRHDVARREVAALHRQRTLGQDVDREDHAQDDDQDHRRRCRAAWRRCG